MPPRLIGPWPPRSSAGALHPPVCIGLPGTKNGGKAPGAMGNPGMGGIIPFMPKLWRLNPRGVPVAPWPVAGGKWPLEVASERDGAMCEGSNTYALMSSN